VLKKYYIKVNSCLSSNALAMFLKKSSYKIEGGSLGLAEEGGVDKKEEVASKRAYKL
jgi:hypothetical protein